jgi:RHS repeat-associated protein
VNIVGTLNNAGTTLALSNATDSWELAGGTINGGTVSTSGGAVLGTFYAGGTLNGVTLAGTLDASLVRVLPGLTVTGGLTAMAATIKLAGNNKLVFSGTETLAGTADIALTGVSGGYGLLVPDAGDVATFAPGITIHGDSGQVGSSGGGSITNQGTITAEGGGSLAVVGATNFAAGALTGGTWQAKGGSTLRLLGAGITTNAAAIVLDGAGARLTSDTGMTNALANLATNAATGVLTIRNGAALTLPALSNAGAVTVGAGSSLAVGTYTQTTGLTVDQGTIGAATASSSTTSAVNLQGGSLTGSGTLNASVTNAAQITPGSAPGILTVGGDYTQSAAGALEIEVGGAAPGTGFDQLVVGDKSTLGGTLNVTLIGGFATASGQVFPVVTYASSSGSFATVNLPQLNGAPAFTTQAAAASFNLRGTGSVSDLAVVPMSITVTPAPAVPGSSVTIQYQANVIGTITSSAGWVDSVYLSPNGVLSGNDPLIGRVTHPATGPVASYTGMLTAPLPGVADGSYRVIVVADSRLQLPDGKRADATAVAATPIAVHSPVLTLGAAQNGTIASGQSRYFRLNIASGQDVTLTADFTAATEAQLYVRQGSLPDQSSYDQTVVDLTKEHPQIKLSDPQGGAYYILLYGLAGAGSGLEFSLHADVAALGVTSLSPSSAGNGGHATFTITGDGFDPSAVVSLQAPDGTLRQPIQSSWQGPATIIATFDLTGVITGSYNIRVDDNGRSASLPGAVSVQPATMNPGTFQAKITTAQYLRPNQPGFVDVEISNPGDTDVPGGLFTIRADNAILGLDGALGTQFVVSLATPDGTSLILPPHFKDTVRFGFQPIQVYPHAKVQFFLSVQGASDSPIDWAASGPKLRPSFISTDAWPAVFANFTAAVGGTEGQYQAVLAQDTSYLSALGENATSTSAALELELEKADDELPSPVLTSAIDDSLPAAGLPLQFARSFLQSISGRYQPSALGRGWTMPYDITATADTQGNVTITTPQSMRVFTLESDGSYQGAAGDTGVLTRVSGMYRLAEKNGDVMLFRPDGLFLSITDPNGNSITAGYTGGELVSLTDSNGESLTLMYDTRGRLTQVSDSAGNVESYSYDSSDEHLMSVSGPAGTIHYTYITGEGPALENALASITLVDGTHEFYDYDARGRLIDLHGDDGTASVTFSYGPAGIVKMTDATGGTETVDYNEFLLPGQIHDPLGNVELMTYNDLHLLVRSQYLSGPSTSYGYDQEANVDLIVDPLGSVVNLAYSSPPSRLTRFQDQPGNVTTFAHDANANLTTVTAPDGSFITYHYDSAGNLAAMVTRGGQTITDNYDSRGLLVSKVLPDGSQDTYTYDPAGRLLTAIDSSGTDTFHYDAAGRVTELDEPGGHSLQFTYNAAGQRVRMTEDNGFVVNYRYDADGRLASLTDASGGLIASYHYDKANRVVRTDLGNGTATTYTYNSAGLLVDLVNLAPGGKTNSSFQYTYDNLGRRTSVTTADGTATYTYDELGQLVSATLPDGRIVRYSYDAAGNRTAVIDGGTETGYAANVLDEYVSVGGAAYTYDGNGDLASTTGGGGTTSATYDAVGHLRSVTTPAGTWTYSYDALGNRVSETSNGQTTDFVIDPLGYGNVVGAYTGTRQLIANYAYGDGLVSRVSAGTGAAYYDFDGTGSTVGLTGSDGSYVDTYSYLPFGEPLSATGSLANPFRYGGQAGVMDDGNGLDYMRARYYLPEEGRFTSADPLDLAGGTNPYTYATNNPINEYDPTGLGYVNIGATAGFILGGTAGINIGSSGVSFYAGVGLVAPGIDPSITYSTSDPSPGWSIAAQASYGIAGQVSAPLDGTGHIDENQWSGELGLGSPGFALLGIYTTPNVLGGFKPLPCDVEDLDSFGNCPTGMTQVPEITIVGNPESFSSVPDTGMVLDSCQAEILFPKDPNDITGPPGYGSAGFVAPGDILPFSIEFQNTSTASAPAQVVTVTQQLDPNLDWSTFELGDFGFGNFTITAPFGRQAYSTRIDARSSLAVYVDVSAGLNRQTGVVTWTFTTIDPTTLDEPTGNVLEGFLPPDDSTGRGEGWVSYDVQPLASDRTGTLINGKATVIFDAGLSDQSSLDTAPIVNTIDAAAPTSKVSQLPAVSTSSPFLVQWSGQDDTGGSGIADFRIYVSDNGGPFAPFLTGTTQTSASFKGTNGHSYAFYSVATDNVGNVEATPSAAQATTKVVISGPPPIPLVTLRNVQLTFNKKHQVIQIIVDFSGPVNAGQADSLATYRLTTAGKRGSFAAKNAKSISLKSAMYSDSTDSVTLAPKKPFGLTKPVQLRVDGVPPSGLTDEFGRLIDGNADGQPGGDAVAVLRRSRVTLAVRAGQGDSPQLAVPALDQRPSAGRRDTRFDALVTAALGALGSGTVAAESGRSDRASGPLITLVDSAAQTASGDPGNEHLALLPTRRPATRLGATPSSAGPAPRRRAMMKRISSRFPDPKAIRPADGIGARDGHPHSLLSLTGSPEKTQRNRRCRVADESPRAFKDMGG